MERKLWSMAGLLALLAVGSPLPLAQAETKLFERPEWVADSFLQYGRHDEGWLKAAMEKFGLKDQIVIGQGMIGAQSLAALKALNRVRTFSYLAAPGLEPPYFDLPLKSANGVLYRCVTMLPKSIVPAITEADFAVEGFSDTDADPEVLNRCKVEPSKGADFTGLDRESFRSRFFGPGGHLKAEFADLNKNTAFIAEAFDLGFFVSQGDLTGRLVIDGN